jgi:hypothetical protein
MDVVGNALGPFVRHSETNSASRHPGSKVRWATKYASGMSQFAEPAEEVRSPGSGN